MILTGNMFGDILSDEAAALAGSIGLIPSLSRGRVDQPALYEPIHGSAPTLAGKDVACPLGAVFSATLMLRESFGLHAESQWIENADRSHARKGISHSGYRRTGQPRGRWLGIYCEIPQRIAGFAGAPRAAQLGRLARTALPSCPKRSR